MNLKDAGIYIFENIFTGGGHTPHTSPYGVVVNNKPRLINIPAYQRPYRWPPAYIERLFSDYDENSEEYFLGSAVIVDQESKNEFDVVDGQQRITTLYLLNYIRFLLKREFVLAKLSKPYQPKSSEYCNSLKQCYVNLVGKNSTPFDNILSLIDELTDDEDLAPEERVTRIIDCYKKQLCIPEKRLTLTETLELKLKSAHDFFDAETLCLKYTRSRYDKVLREAMCNVYLNNPDQTTTFELCTILNTDDGTFENNYTEAMKTIFSCLWSRAVKRSNPDAQLMDICENAIQLADDILKNMSICVILTVNENDANKLFEVLNDRALDVEDLELIKNHFYKEYCTKSDDSDETKDLRITELDELWTDKIFSENSKKQAMRNRLISYFAAVYLTSDESLSYKDDVQCKEAIDKKYSSQIYKIGEKKYNYENILADFNVYYAIKILLSKLPIKSGRANEASYRAEQENKSISYRTIFLLYALGYYSVLPALVNVIISTYAQIPGNSLINPNFGDSFSSFIDNIMNDTTHQKQEYQKIHKCAYMLWLASIKAKDFELPRSIAKRIITKYGHVGFSNEPMDFHGEEIAALNDQLTSWLDAWSYSSKKTFIIKILLLHLLSSKRNPTDNGYKLPAVDISLNSELTYRRDPAKLQLDHLEAKKLDINRPTAYYLYNDPEKRQKDVDGYLGNFMILDEVNNNDKNNVPLYEAMGFYSGIDTAWLIRDIKGMIADPTYFDQDKHIPKEEFFITRSAQLKQYIKALLNCTLDQSSFHISFV